MAVHQRHLELVLEVRHRAQAAHQHAGVLALRVVHQQAAEGAHVHVAVRLEHLAANRDALGLAEQRRLLDVDQERDDDGVEDPGAALDDVDVAVGQRVERPWINGDAWDLAAHE